MTNSAGMFDFSSFDASGVEPIKKALTKAGAIVVDVDAPNRVSRRAGFQVKSATFFMADGQQIVMLLKNDGEGNGDIYQVQLNGRVIPIRNVDSLSRAAGEIAKLLKSNSPTFVKAQRRKQARLKVDESDLDGGKKKRAPAVTNKAKLEEIKTEIKELEEQLEIQQISLEQKKAELDLKAAGNKNIEAEIELLDEENEQLEGAI